jgi:hypothetical protein
VHDVHDVLAAVRAGAVLLEQGCDGGARGGYILGFQFAVGVSVRSGEEGEGGLVGGVVGWVGGVG